MRRPARRSVTPEGANRYGVVVVDRDGHGDWRADTTARDALRAEMTAKATNKIFDFGPGIDVLRERCLEETGLPAPLPPQPRTLLAAE